MAAALWCLVHALILSAALCTTLRDTISTSCDVVVEGASRKLTCHFDVDLSETKLDCTVQKYKLDPTDINPDRVVSCNWKPTDELSCHAYGSYKLNGEVTDTVVIDLPETEREGRYLCQIITNGQKRQNFCTYDGNSVSRTSVDDLIPQNTDTTTQESTQSAEHTSTVAVVVGVTVTTALVILIVLVVVGWWRRRKCAKEITKIPKPHDTTSSEQSKSLVNSKVDINKNSSEDCNKNHITKVEITDSS